MRDSLPLPGLTPAQVVSQLAYRVFGPLHSGRAQIVLDYHGLLANRADPLARIAARHHVSAPTVSYNAALVRGVGTRQPLSPLLVIEAERNSTPEEDHLGRVRIATTLGLVLPGLDHPSAEEHGAAMPSAQLAVARTGVRLLAAVGSLSLPVIVAAVARSRRFRDREPLSDDHLAAGLLAVGCTVDAQGRWHPPAGAVPTDRDRMIVARAAGRDLTRAEMIDILLAAGYQESSATGRMSSSHPLFRRTGPNLYGLVGDGPPSGGPAGSTD